MNLLLPSPAWKHSMIFHSPQDKGQIPYPGPSPSNLDGTFSFISFFSLSTTGFKELRFQCPKTSCLTLPGLCTCPTRSSELHFPTSLSGKFLLVPWDTSSKRPSPLVQMRYYHSTCTSLIIALNYTFLYIIVVQKGPHPFHPATSKPDTKAMFSEFLKDGLDYMSGFTSQFYPESPLKPVMCSSPLCPTPTPHTSVLKGGSPRPSPQACSSSVTCAMCRTQH